MLIYSITNEEDLKAIPNWAQWLELRFDLDANLIDHLFQLDSYKVIITDRWDKEGGKSRRSVEKKLHLYQSLANYDNLYFDIEIALIEAYPDLDLDYRRMILSYHNFEALDIPVIKNKLQLACSLQPFMVKVAQYCSSLGQVRMLHQVIKEQSREILWLVMGEYGTLQRLLFPYLSSIGSFIANLGSQTVEGQLNLKSVEKYQHLLATKLYKWGGLIGGEQVYKSLGLDYYNHHFQEKKIEACYLPINIKESDLKEFFALIKNNQELKENCYGFSLTMPFKKSIPQLFNHKKISNLIIYGMNHKFYNTDYDAFLKLKEKIRDLGIKRILIYGTGSMAELALEVFVEGQISLAGRNLDRLQELKLKRKNIEFIDQISPDLYFDLLINTSSLGMKGESFSQETGISNFKYVIDLPYSQVEIPLQLEVEEENYFSGRDFWSDQSERQLQLFKERIEHDKK